MFRRFHRFINLCIQLVTTLITGKVDREIFKEQRRKSMIEEKEAYSRVQER